MPVDRRISDHRGRRRAVPPRTSPPTARYHRHAHAGPRPGPIPRLALAPFERQQPPARSPAAGTNRRASPAAPPRERSPHPMPPSRRRTSGSSARPRTTRTSRPRVSTTSVSHAIRRAIGSSSVNRRSGRAIASGMPGSPAPDPTSTTVALSGINSAIAAEFSTCRSQSRSTSRGPISPRCHAVLGQAERRTAPPAADRSPNIGSHGHRRSSVIHSFHVKHVSDRSSAGTDSVSRRGTRRATDSIGRRARNSERAAARTAHKSGARFT